MQISLATLPQCSAQQVFDHCARHLLTQKKRSTDARGKCCYRGPGGLKCVAGACIADDEYRPFMDDPELFAQYLKVDGKVVPFWRNLAWYGVVPSAHLDLIGDLTVIHDAVAVKSWAKWLHDVAVRFSLSPEVVHTRRR